MHRKEIKYSGRPVKEAEKVLIMLHGRGANAADILSLGSYLDVRDYALIAPQATGNTWYPYSFLAATKDNEPWLSSAINLISEIVTDLIEGGKRAEHIYFAGFSQGACLTLEFVCRNAKQYGGIVAFTGGLIGNQVLSDNYSGDFFGTPVYIGSSNPDPHVPVARVNETAAVLRKMNANVQVSIFNGIGHTITEDEIKEADQFVFSPPAV